MIRYTAKDIIDRAEQLADLQNSDFISDSEKSMLLNEAWILLYQKIINANDKAFVKTISAYDGMNLPADCFQISALYIKKNKEQIQKVNSSQLDGYTIENDVLYLSPNYDNLEIMLEYFPEPRTLFYSSGKKESKSFSANPKLIIDDNLFIDSDDNLIEFSSDTTLGTVTPVGFMFSNGCISLSDETSIFKNYNGDTLESRSNIPFVVKGNEVTYDVIKSDDDLSAYLLYLSDKSEQVAYFVGKDLKLYTKTFEEVKQL